MKLLERNSQGVSLTPPGQAFLHRARLVLEELENLRGDLHDYARGMKGHINVAASPPAITETLPEVLRAFRATHADVGVNVRELISNEVIRAVSAGTADMGVVAAPLHTESLEVLPYLTDRIALVMSPQHPLAGRDSISFADALEYEIIGVPENSGIYSFMRTSAELQRKTINVNIWVTNYHALCRMVEAGLGIGVISERSGRRYAPITATKLVPLADASASHDIVICARSFQQLPPYARDLVDRLLDTEDARTAGLYP